MIANRRPRTARLAFWTLAAGSALVLLALGAAAVLNHRHLASPRLHDAALPAAALLIVLAAWALQAWWDELRLLEVARAEEARKAQQEAEAAARRVEEERRELARLRRSRRVQEEWLSRLRREVAQAQRERGLLGEGDPRSLILRIAMELLDARKGLLLAREDEDGDGNLDLVCTAGFDHDPTDSAVTQRLAERVLRRDEILHEDDRDDIDGDARTAADREIENLVAIPVYMGDSFSGVVVCANRDGGFADCDDDVLVALGDHAGTVLHNGRLHGQLRNAYLGTVAVLTEAIQAKDPMLKGHCEEVAALVSRVAARMGISSDHREELLFGSLLHDVGKLGISERILLKPGPLTAEERTAVELHPRIGYRMIQRVPALRAMAPAVLHHHERFDGGGYPSGLRGEDIPLDARIVAVADCFSAMTEARPYRKPMTPQEACRELVAGAGTQWDPEIVGLFVDEVEKLSARPPDSVVDDADGDPELEVLDGLGPALGTGAIEMTDSLTLVYSHRYFHEAAASEARRAELQDVGFAVVVGELTQLGAVNRSEGFAAGDELLRAAARSFERVAQRHPRAVAARLSGSRLGLLVPEAPAGAVASTLAGDLDGVAEVRLVGAEWRRGDDGFAVVERALAGLLADTAVAGP